MTLYTNNELTCRMKMIVIKLGFSAQSSVHTGVTKTWSFNLSWRETLYWGRWKKNITGEVSAKMIQNRFDTQYISLSTMVSMQQGDANIAICKLIFSDFTPYNTYALHKRAQSSSYSTIRFLKDPRETCSLLEATQITSSTCRFLSNSFVCLMLTLE